MEKRREVKVYEVRLSCTQCEEGEMVSTRIVYTTYPVEYEYKCNHCDATTTSRDIYPKYEYEPVKHFK